MKEIADPNAMRMVRAKLRSGAEQTSACLVCALMLMVAASARDVRRGQLIQVKVHSLALEHNALGESPDRDVSIYLPPDYASSSRHYPVLYLLHGYTGTDRGWMNPGYVGLPERMDRLIDRAAIVPMIVVMPNCFDRLGGSFYVDSALAGNWETFIVRDLVSYIDAHYRTQASAGARGIAGHSMGGYGALRLGMRHPEVFSAAYGLSPCCSFWDPNQDRADTVEAQRCASLQCIVDKGMGPQAELALAAAFSPDLHNPPFAVDWPFDAKGDPVPSVVRRWKSEMLDAIASAYAAGAPKLHALGFDVGRQDENQDIEIGARRLHDTFTKARVAHQFAEYDGTHSSHIGERMEKVVLPFMSKALK